MATVIVWFLQSFDIRFNIVADSKDSILAMLAGIIAPIFGPLGLGDWRICTSLISGVIAKESVVSTMGILLGNNLGTLFNSLSAMTMLVFSLLYTPCVAAIATIKRELGTSWAVKLVIWQCAIAWICAFLVHSVGTIIL